MAIEVDFLLSFNCYCFLTYHNGITCDGLKRETYDDKNEYGNDESDGVCSFCMYTFVYVHVTRVYCFDMKIILVFFSPSLHKYCAY